MPRQLALFEDAYPGERSGAFISPCGYYRYNLWRRWSEDGPVQCWVMLNPSTADAREDDPTITRLLTRAQAGGFGALAVVNLYAWRSPNPRALRDVSDPVGELNDGHIQLAVRAANQVVCAWGIHAQSERVAHVLKLVQGTALHVLGFTKAGHPGHPLYVPLERKPVLWKAGKNPWLVEGTERYRKFTPAHRRKGRCRKCEVMEKGGAE